MQYLKTAGNQTLHCTVIIIFTTKLSCTTFFTFCQTDSILHVEDGGSETLSPTTYLRDCIRPTNIVKPIYFSHLNSRCGLFSKVHFVITCTHHTQKFPSLCFQKQLEKINIKVLSLPLTYKMNQSRNGLEGVSLIGLSSKILQ